MSCCDKAPAGGDASELLQSTSMDPATTYVLISFQFEKYRHTLGLTNIFHALIVTGAGPVTVPCMPCPTYTSPSNIAECTSPFYMCGTMYNGN
jgi:hypothetical protein